MTVLPLQTAPQKSLKKCFSITCGKIGDNHSLLLSTSEIFNAKMPTKCKILLKQSLVRTIYIIPTMIKSQRLSSLQASTPAGAGKKPSGLRLVGCCVHPSVSAMSCRSDQPYTLGTASFLCVIFTALLKLFWDLEEVVKS